MHIAACLLAVAPSVASPTEDPFDVGQYDVTWASPSRHAGESMPLVGGDLGCNVWVENGELLLYVQRSGCLSENGEFLKLGRVRISLSPSPFDPGGTFSQRLNLADGRIEIEANREDGPMGRIVCWVDVETSTVHVTIDSKEPITARASYENWRLEDEELVDSNGRRERFTCFSLEGYPGKVIRSKDEVAFEGDRVSFHHRNPEDPLVPGVLISQQGLDDYRSVIFDDIKNRTFGGVLEGRGMAPLGISEGEYNGTRHKAWTLVSNAPSTQHAIRLVSHIDQARTLGGWRAGLAATLGKSQDQEASLERSAGWWRRFWERSYIVVGGQGDPSLDPAWRVGRNYQLFRYQLGGNVRGEYPTKFNGGNLSYDPVLVGSRFAYSPDWRQWGGAMHTAQNQRLLYWPMLKAGDRDAILPQFELYRKGLPGARARVQRHFGHGGAVFTEYMNASGLVLGAGWGWDARNHRGRGTEVPIGDKRATGAKGYNDIVEAGVQANQSCAYHYESQLEHAYMMLEYHRFFGADITPYLPFIKESLIFFDEHYRMRQRLRNGEETDPEGRLVIYPSTACETYRGAKNPTDLVAGLNACLKGLLSLGDGALTPKERAYFTEFLGRVPAYTLGDRGGEKVFEAAESWVDVKNIELPQFYPLFPFNEFQLGDGEIDIFRQTYAHAPSFKGQVVSWHQDGIFFARMGMVREAAAYTLRKLKDSTRRFPTFWGPGHDWVPDHNWGGSGMIGLQEMALQTIGDDITVLPAWPTDWPVNLRLHAPSQTIVELSYDGTAITALRVEPPSRAKDLVVPERFQLSAAVAAAFPALDRL